MPGTQEVLSEYQAFVCVSPLDSVQNMFLILSLVEPMRKWLMLQRLKSFATVEGSWNLQSD